MTEPLPALRLFLFPPACSPGPGNLFLAANGAWLGVAATVSASTGYQAATAFRMLAI